jgi:hypothetical protein
MCVVIIINYIWYLSLFSCNTKSSSSSSSSSDFESESSSELDVSLLLLGDELLDELIDSHSLSQLKLEPEPESSESLIEDSDGLKLDSLSEE